MAGLSFGRAEEKLGWNAQPTCAVMMDNVRVPAASLLGSEGKGFNIAMNACEHMLSCFSRTSSLGVLLYAHIVIMSRWHGHVQRYLCLVTVVHTDRHACKFTCRLIACGVLASVACMGSMLIVP